MAVDQRNLPAFLDTDAVFRTWGSGIAAQLAAVGLVKTGDTGQIDWATVLRPAINVYAGYEIYRFNDTLQATKPIFIKIEYGVGASVDRPSLAITVGTSTNGAGTINAQVGARKALNTNANKLAGASLVSYCSGVNTGAQGRVALVTHMDPSNTGFGLCMIVERTHNSEGVDTGDGIFTALNCVMSSQQQMIPSTGVLSALVSGMGSQSPSVGTTSFGNDVALLPIIGVLGKLSYQWVLGYKNADITAGAVIVASMFGVNHNFMPVGQVYGVAESGNNLGGLALLWE